MTTNPYRGMRSAYEDGVKAMQMHTNRAFLASISSEDLVMELHRRQAVKTLSAEIYIPGVEVSRAGPDINLDEFVKAKLSSVLAKEMLHNNVLQYSVRFAEDMYEGVPPTDTVRSLSVIAVSTQLDEGQNAPDEGQIVPEEE